MSALSSQAPAGVTPIDNAFIGQGGGEIEDASKGHMKYSVLRGLGVPLLKLLQGTAWNWQA